MKVYVRVANITREIRGVYADQNVELKSESLIPFEMQNLAQSDAQPVPVGWFESPHGAFRANPDYRLDFPSQLLKWSVPVYLAASPQEAQPTRERLSDQDINGAFRDTFPGNIGDYCSPNLFKFAHAIERIVRGEGAV